MLSYCLLRLKTPNKTCLPFIRRVIHDEGIKKEFSPDFKIGHKDPSKNLAGSFKDKYTIFKDDESPEIFDVEEERQRYQQKDKSEINNQDQYAGLNLDRGFYGVFDVADLVDVLRKEIADDIVVCSIPKELKYVDYFVICSGRSYRHMLAIADFVRRMFKIKRNQNDTIIRIEGEKCRNWMAMDLGNIALHIFSPSARENYDLESLWAIGMKYDKEFNKPQDPLVELFEKHSVIFNENNNIQ